LFLGRRPCVLAGVLLFLGRRPPRVGRVECRTVGFAPSKERGMVGLRSAPSAAAGVVSLDRRSCQSASRATRRVEHRVAIGAPPDKNSFRERARVGCSLGCICSWDGGRPELVLWSAEPWGSHRPKNVDWSIDVFEECCRRRGHDRPSFLSVGVLPVASSGTGDGVTAPPDKNSFRELGGASGL